MTREGGLLAWQWSHYPSGHRNRRNLIIHVMTVPLFQLGTVALLAAPFVHPFLAFGLLGMVAAIALQGRAHQGEEVRPQPFSGPADVAARLFVEQWVTFPRYVLTGEFARAWRAAK